MNLTKFWKIFLISLGSLILLSLITVGLFAYFKKPFLFGDPKIDKYSEIIDWCPYNSEKGLLTVNCKALLLDISKSAEDKNCFDIQIISEGKELKNSTICENTDMIEYTNGVLEYKKLMPVDIIFEYTQRGILNEYSLKKVTFNTIEDDTYTRSILNEDIQSLVTMDLTNTTVKNSVNFCPKPDILPDYVTEKDKSAYTDFYTNNINENSDVEIFNIGNDVMNLFLPCYNTDSCEYSTLINKSLSLPKNVFPPQWGKTLSTLDYTTLGQISYLYSGQSTILPTYAPYASENTELHIATSSEVFNRILNTLASTQDTGEEVFCTLYQAVQNLSINDQRYVPLRNIMQQYLDQNLYESTSPLCYDAADSINYNHDGVYIMYMMSIKDDTLRILNRCLNLTKFLQ